MMIKEKEQVDFEKLKDACTLILEAIGENPEREGLKDTPRRFAAYWQEFINYAPGNYETTFESTHTDQLVVVSGMRVWSICEHHLLPFWCNVSVGYLTGERVIGLSKFARIAHVCAHKLQLQERLVQEIAEVVQELAGVPSVAVIARGKHTCMISRGIKTDGVMISSFLGGYFRDNPDLRSEFMGIVSANEGSLL